MKARDFIGIAAGIVIWQIADVSRRRAGLARYEYHQLMLRLKARAKAERVR